MRYGRARGWRLNYDRGRRGGPLKLAVALGDFLDDLREQLILHGGPLRVVRHVTNVEFQVACVHDERDGALMGGSRFHSSH